MWPGLENLLRRARLRGLAEGKVQTVRAESLEGDAKDAVERWQDYGFAAHPLDGQGLRLEVGGHTIVLRMDRIAERPQLAAYEVALWHKEGHKITLKANGLVQIDATTVQINATTTNISGALNVGNGLNVTGVSTSSGNMVSNADVIASSKSLVSHTHGGVASGSSSSGPPN
jgi:phage baseplate assembly protein V